MHEPARFTPRYRVPICCQGWITHVPIKSLLDPMQSHLYANIASTCASSFSYFTSLSHLLMLLVLIRVLQKNRFISQGIMTYWLTQIRETEKSHNLPSATGDPASRESRCYYSNSTPKAWGPGEPAVWVLVQVWRPENWVTGDRGPSPGAGKDQGLRSHSKAEKASPPCFLFYSGPQLMRSSALLSLWIQRLTSSRNTSTDIPRNNV